MALTKEEKPREGRRSSEVTAPPEGGWGWMIVAGCFLATICIRAVTRCVSIFFVEFQLYFETDYSTTAWIHSLIDCLTMLCAPVGGFLATRLSCRVTLILGGFLSALGFVISGFAFSLAYLYVSLGILAGFGFALSYTPALAMVGKYFNERKALAYGIAQSGSGIGTFILAPVVQLLIEEYSWRGALLILGGFISNLCVCGALMRPLEPRGQRISEDENDPDCSRAELETDNTEEVPAVCSQGEPKQLDMNNSRETQGMLIANGVLKSTGPESDRVAERNLTNLSSSTESTLAECILFSNKLTDTMLAQIKRSDAKSTNGSTIEDMKLVESIILSSNTEKDVQSKNFGEEELASVRGFGDTASLPDSSETSAAAGRSFCRKLREEYRFLVMPDFLFLSLSFLFMAYGCSAPVVYLVPYAISVGVEQQHAAFLMSIFGVSGIVGNITFGWITDRKFLKRFRMASYMLAVGMEGVCCMFVPFLHSFALLVPFAVVYGYFDGAYVALIPVVASDVVGPTYLTPSLGVVYFLHAIPYLISPPIGGWLVDSSGTYTATFFLSGACFMLSSVVLMATMLSRRCWRTKSDAVVADFNQDQMSSDGLQRGVV